MKLSSHSYGNAVFDSLLDGLSDDVVLKKTAAKKTTDQITGSHIFSSTTERDLAAIRDDELRFIAAELNFAAEKARIAVTGEDLVAFASDVSKKGLKGKNLERAARNFCTKIYREAAPPQGVQRTADDLVREARINSVLPAGYNTEFGTGNSKTGGYLGMSKNPNTIWNPETLSSLAAKPEDHNEMYGDEQIKQSQKQKEIYRKAMKDGEWQEKQTMLSDPEMIHNKIVNASTGQEVGTTQALPKNAMSIFSNNREFENIPEKTPGEMIKDAAEQRHTKKTSAKDEWNQVNPSTKADNSGSFFFGDTQPVASQTNTQRDALDWVFESLLKKEG